VLSHGSGGCVPEVFLSASASPDGWPEKGRHIGGQKAEILAPVALAISRTLPLRTRNSFKYVAKFEEHSQGKPNGTIQV
jgi:hypothetical protein